MPGWTDSDGALVLYSFPAIPIADLYNVGLQPWACGFVGECNLWRDSIHLTQHSGSTLRVFVCSRCTTVDATTARPYNFIFFLLSTQTDTMRCIVIMCEIGEAHNRKCWMSWFYVRREEAQCRIYEEAATNKTGYGKWSSQDTNGLLTAV